MLRQWLIIASEPAVSVIDIIATLVIVGSTLQAFIAVALVVLRRDYDRQKRRDIWLTYGRWLVAGLTFQLAADIVESSIVPTWEAIGQLGAVAVIRTFLNYFLEKDIAEIRERQHVVSSPGEARSPIE